MDETPALELLERLLKALAEELPADQPIAALAGDGPFLFDFDIDAQPVKLLCHPLQKPPCVTVACPLGPVPGDAAQAEAALRQLLRLSQAAATSGTTAGFEPVDHCLHLLHVMPLATASARLLVATMAGLAPLARRWREDHFLRATPGASGEAPPAGLRV